MADPSVWLITGTTSGMGAAMVEQFAARGDRIVATGRNATSRLAHLKSENVLLIDLDATAPLNVVKEQIKKAIDIFGRIDFVVNNAGLSVPQVIEEADDAFTDKLLNTNLVSTIRVVQAVLPHFRKRRLDISAFISSSLGWESDPFLTHYATAKAGLSIFVEGLQKEISHLGLKAVIFEPGAFVTGLGQTRTVADFGVGGAPKIPDYQALFGEVWGQFVGPVSQSILSTVEKVPPAIWDVVKSEGMASGKLFPIRVPLGLDSLAVIRQKCHEQLQLCDEWEQVALSTTKEGAVTEPHPYLMDKMSILNLAKPT